MPKRIFFLSVLLLLVEQSFGQVYNITRYSTEAGLIQSQVMAVLQDQTGYLWLGTHRGVCRYDGKQFTPLGTQDGLIGNFLTDMVEDQQGNIWLATESGISRYDHATFTNFSIDKGLLENDVQVLMVDKNNQLWIGYKTKGLSLYAKDAFQHNPFEWPNEKPDFRILSLLEDSTGNVWIGTSKGLFKKAPGKRVLQQISDGISPPTEEILSLAWMDNRLWLGTPNGLYEMEGDRFIHHGMQAESIPDHQIYCMVADRDDQLWLGTRNGLVRFADGQFFPLSSKDRMLDFHMRSGIQDREGNLWFGTDGGGVRKVTKGVFEHYSMGENLSSNIAKSFLEDKQGRIWISTKDRGISLFEKNSINKYFDSESGLGGNDICFSYEDRLGQFWFASYNGTLTRFDGKNFQAYGKREGLDCTAAYAVTEDEKGHIWVGTDNGIFILNGNRFYRRLTTQDGLIDNTIYALTTSRDKTVWAGTAKGVSTCKDGKCSPVNGGEAIGNNVITLLEDPYGRMWVGSAVGLAFVENGHPTWVKISGASGAHTVVALVVEADKYLWVGTENGAYRLDLIHFNPDSDGRKTFEHYTQKDGLPSLECNANAAFQDSEGNIWLGTSEGAIRRLAGTQTDTSHFQPLIYITDVQTSGEETWQNRGFEVDRRGLPIKLNLPSTDNRLEFEFIGISLKSPKQVEYRFMLEGVDNDWLRPTRVTSVLYPNLRPGNYTFKVTAKKEAEPWDYRHVDTFSFSIAPPFWQTWWFISLAILIAFAIGWSIYQTYAERLRRIREERMIRNQAEKLQLEHQALYAMMNPHFTFNALQSIQYFIHRQDKKAANKFLSSFAKLVRKNLESTKVDFISLGEEIERLKLYLSLEKMRFPEKFDYKVNVAPDIELSETQLPPMLLQPFVENSIKHGIMPLDKDGMITIDIQPEGEDFLRIKIQDNGIGIEASKKSKINRPSDHVSKGMQITLDRLALFARMTGKTYSLDIRELMDPQGNVAGTEVEMMFPLKYVG